MTRRSALHAAVACLSACAFLIACGRADRGGLDAGTARLAEFGDPCGSTGDCASGLCLAVSSTQRICTRVCTTDAQCPRTSNWGCVAPEGFDARVCGCIASAAIEICGNGTDDDCNGASDDCLICDGAEVPPSDRGNCGACGRACRADQECTDAACACPAGRDECGGACTDFSGDEANCGACGTSCPSGQNCSAGVCSCMMPGATYCPSIAECSDLDVSVANCGACGNACSPGAICTGGTCTCTTSTQPDYCVGVGCVDLDTSSTHCGACGLSCDVGRLCRAGACTCAVAGTSDCGTVIGCVPLSTDTANCGTCGRVCDPGARCSSGTCVCDSGVVCGSTCVATTDVSNCGACGNVCDSDQYCGGGACTCFSGTRCGDACVDLRSDSTNCGACGALCRSGEPCASGLCRCASGQTWCASAGTCIPTTADPLNCGGCGITCDDAQVCSASACVCPISGQTYCAGTDTCSALPTSAQNCGACGNACRNGETCVSGACRCPTGQTWCAGADTCVSLASDANNCGVCENVCPAETACVSRVCRCTGLGLTLCGSSCVDVLADEANCGSCGRVCGATEICLTGTCSCPLAAVGVEQRLTDTAMRTWMASDIAVGVGEYAMVVVEQDALNELFPRLIRMSPTGSVLSTTPLTPNMYEGLFGGAAAVWTGAEWMVLVHGSHTAYMVRVDTTGTVLGATTFTAATSPTARAWHADLFHYASSFVAVLYGQAATTTNQTPNVYFISAAGVASARIPVVASASVTNYVDFDAALSPDTGEIALLTKGFAGAVYFVRLTALGASVLPVLSVFPDTNIDFELVHTGTTWMAAAVNSVAGRSIGVALGDDLAMRGIVSPARAITISSVTLAQDPTGPDALVAWGESSGPSTNALRMRRMRGVTAVGPVEAWGSTNVHYEQPPGACISGSSGLIAWIEFRPRLSGPLDVYALPFAFDASCPP